MTELTALAGLDPQSQARRRFLFVACFVALVATAFAFAIRTEKGAFISAGQVEKVEEDLGKLAVTPAEAVADAEETPSE